MSTQGISRRELVAGCAGAVALLAFGGGTTALAGERELLRPPGGQDASSLLSLCVRCDRCRQACPMNAIESCTLEDGVLNARTPKLNFRKSTLRRTLGTTEYEDANVGYCDFCDPDGAGGSTLKCVAACPTGALRLFDRARERIGLAVIDEVYCINFSQAGQTPTGCRRCVDACPYGAVVIDEERQRPEVDASKCNGCGKCEAACPSANYRAFVGESEMRRLANEGNEAYARSLEYYEHTRRIPRGINVVACDDSAIPKA